MVVASIICLVWVAACFVMLIFGLMNMVRMSWRHEDEVRAERDAALAETERIKEQLRLILAEANGEVDAGNSDRK